MLTGLEIWVIEGQLLATAFICRRQGQQLVGAPRSNQVQPYLPVRLSTKQWQQWFKRLYICDHFSIEMGVVFLLKFLLFLFCLLILQHIASNLFSPPPCCTPCPSKLHTPSEIISLCEQPLPFPFTLTTLPLYGCRPPKLPRLPELR